MRRRATGLAALTLIVLAGCSGGATTPAGPGAEVTDGTTATNEPTQESEQTTESNGNQGTPVELPGLPIGGSEIEFTEPSTQCADVSLTGDPLPGGVRVQITAFAVPAQFSVSSQPCGSSPPCLNAELAADAGCQVAITWNGEQLPEGQFASLAVGSAVATCDDPTRCEDAAEIVAAAPPQTIGILLPTPDEPTEEPTDSPTTDPTDGSTDGASEEPTVGSSGSESPAP